MGGGDIEWYNLLQDGYVDETSNSYLIHRYQLKEIMTTGEYYTIAICAKTEWGWIAWYGNNDTTYIAGVTIIPNEFHIYYKTFQYNREDDVTSLLLYNIRSTETNPTHTLKWAMLFKGSYDKVPNYFIP